MNGMEVAKQLTHNSRIIFITSYGEYALAAFDVNAVHYLLKPVTEERLSLALDRAFERLEQGEDN
jgi:two-component SAPR family response regulator